MYLLLQILFAKERYESLPPRVLSELLALRRRKEYLRVALDNLS